MFSPTFLVFNTRKEGENIWPNLYNVSIGLFSETVGAFAPTVPTLTQPQHRIKTTVIKFKKKEKV